MVDRFERRTRPLSHARLAVALGLMGLLWLLICPPRAVEAGTGGAGPVIVFAIDGPIGPATSDFAVRTLERAEASGARLAVIRMDTPGGLDTAMREIIKKILAAPVPVAAFVAPGGARAASAGTYILYASHIAAMAPGTNLGAATPVSIGVPDFREPEPKDGKEAKPAREPDNAMARKMVNDAVAYLQGLARLRGRNADWAEKAVREAASLPADEALAQNVIELMAADVPELLAKLQGRKVRVAGRELTLDLAAAPLVTAEPDWRSRVLAVITNPNMAYILMLVGVYGLVLEFSHPGAVLPGILGAICLLVALYAFQVLPVNYAGLGLMLLGVALMVAEAFAPSFGALGLGGAAAFVIGSVMLMDGGSAPGFAIDPALIVAFALASLIFFGFVLGFLVRARRRPVVTGESELVGAVGVALEDFAGVGKIRLRGEIWNARSAVPVRQGQRLFINKIEGLTLWVEPERSEP